MLVVVVFAVTRLGAGWVADHSTDVYEARTDPSFELANYRILASRMQDEGLWPYRDFDLEYPPGVLPLANLPYAITEDAFEEAYIVLSIAFDAAGLVAVYRIARRRSSWWGVVAWLVLLPLAGPISYTRQDMFVAAALAWALERAERGRWPAAGALLGLGAAIKLTPALLLPALVLIAPRRARALGAAVVAGGVFLVPFLRDLPELVDQVGTYHLDRGIHAESLWGAAAVSSHAWFGTSLEIVPAFGAYDIDATVAGSLKILANLAALGVLLDSALAAGWRVKRGDGEHLALHAFATMTLLVAVGRVFSPQYVVWLVAPLAVALGIAPRALRWSAACLAGAVVLTHAVYPIWFFDYFALRWWALAAADLRNVLLVVAGLLAARAAWRFRSDAPAVEEHQVLVPALADGAEGPDR